MRTKALRIMAGMAAGTAMAGLLGGGATARAEPKAPTGREEASAEPGAASYDQFGFDFYRELVATRPYRASTDANIALSPLSLASVLEVLRLGSVREAKQELTSALYGRSKSAVPAGTDLLKPGELSHQGVMLEMGNSLWVKETFQVKKSFMEAAGKRFGSVVFRIDLDEPKRAAARINGWISEKTGGNIKDLIAVGDLRGANLVIANAVYFKGDWAEPFSTRQTRDEPFRLISGKSVTVPTMHQVETFPFAEAEGVKLLALPYSGEAVSLILLLPKPGEEALTALERSLTGRWLQAFVAKCRPRRVEVTLPRFTLSCEPENTIPVLKALGIEKIFSPGKDLELIAREPLSVGIFKHRARLEVNERGTLAAAATAAMVLKAAMPSNPATFEADRPFLFVIRHNATGASLFVGRVSNPK